MARISNLGSDLAPRGVRLAITAAVLLVAAAPTARADIVSPGMKKVRRNSVIDLGEYASRAPWPYVVEAGDTLGEIAAKHLGSATRFEEILELNPGVKPSALKVKQLLVMPPKSTDRSQWVHFFAVAWMSQVERAWDDQPLLHHHYWTELWAVPDAKVKEFLERSGVDHKEKRKALEALSKEPWVARAAEKLCGYESLSDRSAVGSIREDYIVRKVEFGKKPASADAKASPGKITLELTKARKLDREGQVLTVTNRFFTPANGLLLLFAVLGVTGLVVVSRRRGGDYGAEPATAS